MVVLCHVLQLEVIAAGEPTPRLGFPSTVLTCSTSVLGPLSSSPGSPAALQDQQAKRERAAVPLCSTQSARQRAKQHEYQLS